MARAAYAAALLCLLLLLPLSLASSAAIEVRLGPQLFDDLAALVNAALPNVTKGILPIALPDQSKSVLNVKADIYNVSLVQLDLSPVEISILTTPGAFHVAMYAPLYLYLMVS